MGHIQLDLSDVEIVDEVITLDDGDIALVVEPEPRRRLPAPRRAVVVRPRVVVGFDDAQTRVFAMRRAAG